MTITGSVIMGCIICALVVAIPLYALHSASPYLIQSIGLSIGLITAFALMPMISRPEIDTKPIHIGDNLPNLITRIATASTEVRIVSGEAHPKIFDDDGLIDVLEKAHKRGVSIKMICGPTIAVADGSENKSRKLFNLARSGTVDLYISSPYRQKTHFTIIDRDYVYKEEPHRMLDNDRIATTITSSFWESNRLADLFKKEMDNSIPFKNARENKDYYLKYESEIRESEENSSRTPPLQANGAFMAAHPESRTRQV